MKIRAILWLTLAFLSAAFATPITYTISTTAGGSLNGSSFSDNTITFTGVSDTSLVATCFVDAICSGASTSNTVTIQGIGTFTLPDSTVFFDNPTVGDVGFLDNLTTLVGEFDPAFTTYTMVASLGPLFNTVGTVSSTNLPTSGGSLTFTGNSLDATFQAVTSASAVPEPGSMGLILAAAISVGIKNFASRLRLTRHESNSLDRARPCDARGSGSDHVYRQRHGQRDAERNEL